MARNIFRRSKPTRPHLPRQMKRPCFLRKDRRNGLCIDTSCFRTPRALDLAAEPVIHRRMARPHDAKRLVASSWNLEHNLNFFENPHLPRRPKPLQPEAAPPRREVAGRVLSFRGDGQPSGCASPSRHRGELDLPPTYATRTLHVAPLLSLSLEGLGNDQPVNWSPVSTGAESPRGHPPKRDPRQGPSATETRERLESQPHPKCLSPSL